MYVMPKIIERRADQRAGNVQQYDDSKLRGNVDGNRNGLSLGISQLEMYWALITQVKLQKLKAVKKLKVASVSQPKRGELCDTLKRECETLQAQINTLREQWAQHFAQAIAKPQGG